MPSNQQPSPLTARQHAEIERLLKLIEPKIQREVGEMFKPLKAKIRTVETCQ